MKYLRHLSLGLFFFLLISGLSATNPQQVRYHVKPTGSDSNNGTSWGTAFQTVQKAIDMASNGDEIWVAAGTYKPTKDASGNASPSDPRDRTFYIDTDGIWLYGGFAGTETALSQRVAGNETILSGDIGTAGDSTDNCYTVMLVDGSGNFSSPNLVGISPNTRISGFTIQEGNADGGFSPRSEVNGGGMFLDAEFGICSPTLSNCIFKDNHARSGGALAVRGLQGISRSEILDCIFQHNDAGVGGGAIYFYAGFTNAINDIRLINCLFIDNQAGESGGAVTVALDNSMSQVIQKSEVQLINCTLSRNEAGRFGGGVSLAPEVTKVSFSNCILWENAAGSQEDNIHIFFSSSNAHKIAISHSLIGNAYPSGVWDSDIGTDEGGNLDADPLFTDPANGDLTLQQCSPSIEAGDQKSSKSANSTTTDLAGNPRFYNNGTIDMGAYEYQGAFVACCPTTVFVDSAATGANDGSSWADAYTDLQDAIDFVANGCSSTEIWVAKGTYFPSRDQTGNASPSDPRDKTFYINTDGTQLYGGFAGTETDKSQRVAGNETILSGDFNDDDVVTGSGSTLSITRNSENAYHVVYMDGTTANGIISNATVFDGFTVTGGNGNGSSGSGGGIFNDGRGSGNGCSPTLTNCSFSANSASGNGGGMYNDGVSGTSSPVLTNCSFSANSAINGGGMYNDGVSGTSSPVLTNCSFSANSAIDGGGMYNNGQGGTSNPVLTNCSFSGNWARSGGGMFNNGQGGTSNPILTDCSFSENSGAGPGGGGMFNISNSPVLTNCSFSGNSASGGSGSGGGMFNGAGGTGNECSPVLTNCFFSENSAVDGGAMLNDAFNGGTSSPTLTNCSFSGNSATRGGGVGNAGVIGGTSSPTFTNCSFSGNSAADGGAMYNNAFNGGTSSPTLTNCILWGNGSEITEVNGATATVSYSILQGGWTGAGGNNLDEDPLFTDPANGDLSLQQCSPAIDAGDGASGSSANSTTTDLAGNARFYNSGTIDMGAYEFQSAKPTPTMSCLSSETVQLDANGSYSLAASDLDNGSNGACGSLSFTIEGNTAKTFSCSELGANTITLTATDQDNQAIGTCQVSVTVQDIQTPTARCQPATVSLDANGQASLAASQVDNGSSDNCQISLSVSPSSFDCSQVGSQNVTLTVTDQAGNSASCATSVQVVDDIKPSLNCPVTPVDLQADAQGNINIPDLSAQISPTDNCGTISSITHAQGLRSVIGSCPANNFEDLRFRILDGNGNELEKTCQNFIRVQDAIKPVISCPSSPIQVTIPFDGATCQPGTVSLSLSDATQAGASVSDNIDTGVSFSQIDANSFSLSQVGQAGLSVTLRANDCFGNAADQACDVQVAAAPSFTAEWELNGGTYTVCPDDFPLSISLAQGTPACGSWSGDVNVSTNPLQLEASAFPDNDNNNLPDLGTYQVTYSVGPVGAQTSKSLNLTVALTPSLSRQGCGSCNQIRLDVCQGSPAPDLAAFVQNNNPGYQTGATLRWYADAGNSQGAALPAAPSLSTANAGRQFFWVSQEAGGCESDAIRVRVWVRERSRAVLDLPTACSGTQVNLARHVSDLNGLATGYEFWDDVPGIGTLLGTVSATNGVVPANQNLFVTLASQTTTYYAVPLNPYNCQVAGSDQLSVASSTLDPVSNITVTNGDPVQVTFNTTASQVVWYNLNNPSIGLIGAAGIGNISFTAQNSGSTPLTANLFAIAYDGGCASQTQNFSITVNPGGANRQAQGDYLSLQAHRINAHDVQLRWSIRYQQPLSHFVVEKWQGQGPLPEDYLILNQESNWKVLGEVEAIGLEGSYAFTDPSGMRNQNYYRVRLLMPDGRLTWSEVVQVNMEYFQSDRFEVFPNPTKDVVQLRCKLEQFHGWSLQLSDQLGRIIRQQPIREQTSRISLREFAPGVYYLKIEGPEGKTYLRKVVRQ